MGSLYKLLPKVLANKLKFGNTPGTPSPTATPDDCAPTLSLSLMTDAPPAATPTQTPGAPPPTATKPPPGTPSPTGNPDDCSPTPSPSPMTGSPAPAIHL